MVCACVCVCFLSLSLFSSFHSDGSNVSSAPGRMCLAEPTRGGWLMPSSPLPAYLPV